MAGGGAGKGAANNAAVRAVDDANGADEADEAEARRKLIEEADAAVDTARGKLRKQREHVKAAETALKAAEDDARRVRAEHGGRG